MTFSLPIGPGHATIAAMSSTLATKRILVAGASGFVGLNVVYALLGAGASVTALTPPGAVIPLDNPEGRLRVAEADAWNRPSLSGRGRGHDAVIHVIGSLREQPARGLTYHYLNVDSLQNVARMAVSDGVPHLIYVSTSNAPWLPRGYAASKREAEAYLQRSGCPWTIIRAPLAYPRGQMQNPALLLTALLGAFPLVGRPFERWAPMPVDVLAKGIAQIALSGSARGETIYGHRLRAEARLLPIRRSAGIASQRAASAPPGENDIPFGWLP